jgi:hypothetical protein
MSEVKGSLSRTTKGKSNVVESNNLNPKGGEIVNTEVKTDVEPITTPPDEEAISKAKALVEKTKASYEHAKTALALLIGKSEKTDKPIGVIGSIFNLVKGSGKAGISKTEILDQLILMFPDREKAGMEKTIGVQLPSRMAKERDCKIEKTADGKYFMK